MENLTTEMLEHIRDSSMDPSLLAEQYGVSKSVVNALQMGTVSCTAAMIVQTIPGLEELVKKLTSDKYAEQLRQQRKLDQKLTRSIARHNHELHRDARRQAITTVAPRSDKLTTLLGPR